MIQRFLPPSQGGNCRSVSSFPQFCRQLTGHHGNVAGRGLTGIYNQAAESIWFSRFLPFPCRPRGTSSRSLSAWQATAQLVPLVLAHLSLTFDRPCSAVRLEACPIPAKPRLPTTHRQPRLNRGHCLQLEKFKTPSKSASTSASKPHLVRVKLS
jgi:hypothetical protein